MIKLRNVSKVYNTTAGAFTALRHLDLDVHPGELVALVGKSGSGKSTLLNVIGGIDAPSTGTITVAGETIQTLNESRLAAWRGRDAVPAVVLPTLVSAAELRAHPVSLLRSILVNDVVADVVAVLEHP